MAGLITRQLCEWRKIQNNIPSKTVDLIVGMMLSPNKDGSSSKILDTVIRQCTIALYLNWGKKISFSNRFMANGKNLAQTAQASAIVMRAKPESVVVPAKDPEGAVWIRDTFHELLSNIMYLFGYPVGVESPSMAAIDEFLSQSTEKRSMLIVANNIHMPRVRRAYLALTQEHLKNLASRLDIYRISVKNYGAYGGDVVQKRFKHPLYFLIYEILALYYSKRKGWA